MTWAEACNEVQRNPEGWKARLIRASTAVLVPAVARVQGIRFPDRRIDGWWWTTRWQMEILMRRNEPISVAWCRRMIRPGMTVVDVGAHMGYYTRLFSTLVGPRGRVIALEPHPGNFELLRFNTRHCPNVTILAVAASDHDGEATLHWSVGSSNHSLVEGYTYSAESSVVSVRRLDTLVSRPIDFLKVDVEGAEVAVLCGAPVVAAALVECNVTALAAAGTSPSQLEESLRSLGLIVKQRENLGLDTWNWLASTSS